mgnify:CR=1 FL=1|jgi:uncharacterized LabA/DUF88 family protein
MSNFKFELTGRTWVIVDWSNVFGWFKDIKFEIDPKKLYNYLSTYEGIKEKRLYFGIDNSTEKTKNAYEAVKSSGFTVISKEVKLVPISLKDSPFKEAFNNASEELREIEESLKTIGIEINKLNEMLEDLKGPHIGFDLIKGESTYVGIDFNCIVDSQNVLNLMKKNAQCLHKSLLTLNEIITKEIKRRKCDFDVEISRDIYKNFNEIDTLILFSGDGDFKAIIEDFIRSNKKVIVVYGAGHLGKEISSLNDGIFKCNVKRLREFVSK